MAITYTNESDLSAAQFADVLQRSTLAKRRPVNDSKRLAGMLQHADVVITARNSEGVLVGISRAVSDFNFCTYLSDLAVDVEYQRQGIGKELVRKTHEIAGNHTTLILLAAPAAIEYYPNIGMEQHDSCWMIKGKVL